MKYIWDCNIWLIYGFVIWKCKMYTMHIHLSPLTLLLCAVHLWYPIVSFLNLLNPVFMFAPVLDVIEVQ